MKAKPRGPKYRNLTARGAVLMLALLGEPARALEVLVECGALTGRGYWAKTETGGVVPAEDIIERKPAGTTVYLGSATHPGNVEVYQFRVEQTGLGELIYTQNRAVGAWPKATVFRGQCFPGASKTGSP